MIIISGYQGVGKTTLSEKYENRLLEKNYASMDLESSDYDKKNPEWYKTYVDDIVKTRDTLDLDVIFISSHLSVRKELNDRGIPFLFVLPLGSRKEEWTKILAKRVQDSIGLLSYEKNVKALISHILNFDSIIDELKEANKPFETKLRPFENLEFIPHPELFKHIVDYRIEAEKKVNTKRETK